MHDSPTLRLSRSHLRLATKVAFGLALIAPLALPLAAQQKTTIRDRAAREAEQKPRAVAGIGVIDGVVTDTLLRPLGAADISVIGVDARVVTSESGKFRFLQVPAGQYLLVVRRIGFAPTSGIIEVPADDTLRLAYTLGRSITMLDTMAVNSRRVTTRMLEFEVRRRQAQGQFLTQEEIERKGSIQIADHLRNFRGIEISRVTTQQFAGTQIYSRREGGGYTQDSQLNYCPLQVVLDGIILPRNFNLDLLPSPKQIAGIEVYSGPATVPPQFGGPDRRCGLMAVWTRDGY